MPFERPIIHYLASKSRQIVTSSTVAKERALVEHAISAYQGDYSPLMELSLKFGYFGAFVDGNALER